MEICMKILDFKTFFIEQTEKCTIYSHSQLNDLRKFADRLLEKFGIDIEFTSHFGDRLSDTRNDPCIKLAELQQLFKKISKDQGHKIKAVSDPEAVLVDLHANLNLPFVVTHKNGELVVTLKTVMRKKRIYHF